MNRHFALRASTVATLASALCAASGSVNAAGEPFASALGVLTAARITPSALAAAGVTTSTCNASQLPTAALARAPMLRSSFSTIDGANHQLTRFRESAARSGMTLALDQSIRSESARRQAARAAAEAANRDVRLFASGLASQSGGGDSHLVLSRMSANMFRPVPEAFKCLDLGDERWQLLQAALRKTERGVMLSTAEREAMLSAQTNPLVHLVGQRLEAHSGLLSASLAVTLPAPTQP